MNPLLLEGAVVSPTADLLGHCHLSKKVLAWLQKKNGEERGMIGVFGPWGSGKSGVLRMAHAYADALPNKPIIWHNFDAWTHQAERMLILSVVRTVIRDDQKKGWEALGRIALALSTTLADLALKCSTEGKMSAKDVSSAFKLIDKEWLQRSKEELIRSEFADVVDRIVKKNHCRIVVAIDNLDRCRPEVAVQVLESLHLLHCVPGCSFVVAADQQVMISFINRTYQGTEFNGAKYLEKIFPDYIRIPDPYVEYHFDQSREYKRTTSGEIEARSMTHYKNLKDQIVPFLKSILPESGNWSQGAADILETLWVHFSSPRILRNPRRIKRIVRRLLEETLPEFEDDDAECVLFLVVLSDVWPEAYELFMRTDERSWTEWVDYMGGETTTVPSKGVLMEDQELRAFIGALRSWYGGNYVADSPIRDLTYMGEYVDWAQKLGL